MILLSEHIYDFDLDAALQIIPEQRRDYALKYQREIDRRLSVKAYLLLCEGLRELYGIQEMPLFSYTPSGKPMLTHYPEIHFNLSHCDEAILCAIDTQPIGGSFVLPAAPFSIVDKVKHLKSAGFNKVLIDFSKVKVTRNQIKAIMASMTKAQALPDVSRFNWKDGFYSPQQMEEYKAANERALQRKQAGKGNASQGRYKNKSSGKRRK